MALGILVDALLPRRCVLCAAASRSAFCPDCALELPVLARPRCHICALPIGRGERCGRCLARPPHFDATVAAAAYAYPVDRLVQGLKYGGRLHLAPVLAELLAAEPAPEADALIPVPLHPQRLCERGFNQAAEIARHLARHWRLPLHALCCERLMDAPPQASLPWKSRADNVRGAFRVVGNVAGRHVAVVDDVMTTGATLEQLAQVLKLAGARRVTNVVVTRTLVGE